MSWRDWWARWRQRVGEFMAGASLSWTLVPYRLQQRAEMERIFALMLNAQLLGLPLLPPDHSLDLLPYLIPNLLYWRRMTAFDREMGEADLRHLGH